MKSKYLKAFQALVSDCSDAYELIGDCLIVEEMPEVEEKSKGGIIMPSKGAGRQVGGYDDNKPVYVRVVAVGNGYYDLDGLDVPLESMVGDIVIVGKLSVEWFSTFAGLVCNSEGSKLGLVRESEIKVRFKGQDNYEKVSNILRDNT